MTLCSTPESLNAAIQALSGHSYVFLDCEGQTLGQRGGKLSLLSLGIVHQNGTLRLETFLIDVLAFEGYPRSQHMNPIFDLLRSDQVFKVVFDGRMDASELLHGHNVRLRNVLDLQVADIVSRYKRQESDDQRLQRLVGFLSQYEITRNRALYLQVDRLNGLDFAVSEHGIVTDTGGHVDHGRWLQRPLQQTALKYAADDIRKICLLYYKLDGKGYITGASLVEQSARYLALHALNRPHENEKYKRHGLFPLGILSEPTGALVRCGGCDRDLPTSAFPGSTNHGNRFCFVCRAVDAKAGPRRVNYEDLDLYDDFNDNDNDFHNDFDEDDNYDDFNDHERSEYDYGSDWYRDN